MYRRPTSPDEFPRPYGCLEFADRSSSAAEFTAPHATMMRGASTRHAVPLRMTSTASARRPDASVNTRSAFALVQRVTWPEPASGPRQHVSASLLAPSWQGNELQVLHRMHPPGAPGLDQAERQGRGMQALLAQPADDLGHLLGVWNRAVRKRATRRLCRVGPYLTVNVVEPLGSLVVRCERFVLNRPLRRYAAGMLRSPGNPPAAAGRARCPRTWCCLRRSSACTGWN